MIGDVIEIDTRQGLAYAHYSHKNKKWGDLLRVFNRRYSERPADFTSAMSSDPSFLVFFPLGGMINRGIVSIAGHVPLTVDAQVFPRFREGIPSADTGKVETWWIWDGERSHRVGNLTDEIRALSPLGVCNDTYLIAKILKDYTPETDTELDGWAEP